MPIVEMKSRKDTYRTKAGVCEKETTTFFVNIKRMQEFH